MTEQKKRLLKARIALALRDEWGRQPTTEEIEKFTFLASVLFKSVGGTIAMKSKMRQSKQIPLWG